MKRNLLALVLLGGCGGSSVTNPPPPPPPPPGPVSNATVEVRNSFFTPETVVLTRGGTVTFRWVGSGHTVTSVLSPTFAANTVLENAGFILGPITFNNPGTYNYICNIHGGVSPSGQTSGMRGVIVVQ